MFWIRISYLRSALRSWYLKWTNESFPRLDSSRGNYCRTSDIVRPKCCKCPTNFAMRDEMKENIFTIEKTMTAYVWSRLWTINNKRFFQLNTRGVLLRKIHIVKHGQHFCWFWEYFQWNKYHHFGSLLFSELNCHNCQNYRCPGHFFSRKSGGEFVYEHVQ